jgi:hypothetical protein
MLRYRLDTTSAGKMSQQALSQLHDFITRYHYDAKKIAEISFYPKAGKVTFAVIQFWADGKKAEIEGQTVVEDETHNCKPEAMLPFLGYTHSSPIAK